MKKFNFEIAQASLSREEMRNITGGNGRNAIGCLSRKCGSDHPGVSCCAQSTCSDLTNGYCRTN
jgi:hypothetical protein